MHYYRAALQQRGASQDFINEFEKAFRKLSKTPEAFERWNRLLTPKEVQVLAMMLTPGPDGESLCQACLEGLMRELQQRYGVTAEDVFKYLNRN